MSSSRVPSSSSSSSSSSSPTPTAIVVGGTRRADGSVRKTVTVKPGHKTEEVTPEARIYKPKGRLQQESAVAAAHASDPTIVAAQARAKARAEKRRKKREEKRAAWIASGAKGKEPDDESDEDEKGGGDGLTSKLARTTLQGNTASAASSLPSSSSGSETPSSTVPASSSTAVDVSKQLKSLHKKLRQIEALELAASRGERELSQEEREKIEKKRTIEQQIASLQGEGALPRI